MPSALLCQLTLNFDKEANKQVKGQGIVWIDADNAYHNEDLSTSLVIYRLHMVH